MEELKSKGVVPRRKPQPEMETAMPRYTSLASAGESSPTEDQMRVARILNIKRLPDYTGRELARAIVRVASCNEALVWEIRIACGVPWYEHPTSPQIQDFILLHQGRHLHPTGRQSSLVSA